MWYYNSSTCCLYCNRQCMCQCHIARVPCSYTNPMPQYWYNNVLLSSTSFQNDQSAPENTIYSFSHASNPVNLICHLEHDQEAGEQMATNETDPWLVPYPYNNQIDGSLNFPSYFSLTGNQDHGQSDHMQTHGIPVNYTESYGPSSTEGVVEQQGQTLMFSQGIQNDHSTSSSLFYGLEDLMSITLLHYIICNRQFEHVKVFSPATWHEEPGASHQPTDAGIIREATIGTTNLPLEWEPNQFCFTLFRLGNLVEEIVGSRSNSTGISSLETQPLSSRDDLKMPPLMSRQEKILRYLEKKKSRKYEKKTIHSSRKTYARTRPRVRGRFARISQTDAK